MSERMMDAAIILMDTLQQGICMIGQKDSHEQPEVETYPLQIAG